MVLKGFRLLATSTGLDGTSDDLTYALRRVTAPWLTIVLRTSGLLLAASGIIAIATRSTPSWWVYGSFATVTLAALVLDRAKRSDVAGIVLSLGFWMSATLAVLLLGGVRSPGTFVYLPIVITAALFWSWRAAGWLTLASIGVVTLAMVLELQHHLPTPLQAPTAGPLTRILVASLIMTGVLVGIAIHCLQKALADIRRYADRAERFLLDAPDTIAVLDQRGVVTGANTKAFDAAGYPAVDILGKHFTRVPLFARGNGAIGREMREVVSGGRRTPTEMSLVRKDGSPFWAEAHVHEIVRNDGSASARIVLRDITRRKLAEERLAQLDERVVHLQRFEQMGRVVGGVTHDVNNLLTVIMASASVLEAQVAKGSLAEELVGEISASATRAAALERSLLAVPCQKTIDTVDVSHVVDGLRHILSRLVGSNVNLELRSNGSPCFVRADPAHLEQIVLNLAANARDAMPQGGRLLVATAHPPDTSAFQDHVELVASDTGVGMDESTIAKIFDPFYTTKGTGGTGLGLATVREIVTRLGGRILVESELGRGTNVRVFLPAARETLDS